jgi:hypothetical protein
VEEAASEEISATADDASDGAKCVCGEHEGSRMMQVRFKNKQTLSLRQPAPPTARRQFRRSPPPHSVSSFMSLGPPHPACTSAHPACTSSHPAGLEHPWQV